MEATCNHERQIQIVVSLLFIKSKQKMLMKRSRVKRTLGYLSIFKRKRIISWKKGKSNWRVSR
jgi:Holliday junction resolvase